MLILLQTMYSLSYLYQALGDNEYADRCELAAFNALPVMTTSNQWARQYVVLANQPFSYHLIGATPFFNVGQDGIVYGLGTCNCSIFNVRHLVLGRVF